MQYFGFNPDGFNNYAIKHMGVSSYQLNQWEILQQKLYVNSGFYTPNITETSTKHMLQLSVFDKMAQDRILFIGGVVNDMMSTVVSAQLMYMDSVNTNDITLNIDSPGGSVKSGLTIYDVANYIESDIATICTGMGASMGSILTGMGTKGKRFILPNARIMLHQVSSGASGHVEDMGISYAEAVKYNDKLFQMLSDFTGKPKEIILQDANRDLWLDAESSVEYGIVDGIIKSKKELIK